MTEFIDFKHKISHLETKLHFYKWNLQHKANLAYKILNFKEFKKWENNIWRDNNNIERWYKSLKSRIKNLKNKNNYFSFLITMKKQGISIRRDTNNILKEIR